MTFVVYLDLIYIDLNIMYLSDIDHGGLEVSYVRNQLHFTIVQFFKAKQNKGVEYLPLILGEEIRATVRQVN